MPRPTHPQAPATTVSVATLAQTFTLKDANGSAVGISIADKGGSYHVHNIGARTVLDLRSLVLTPLYAQPSLSFIAAGEREARSIDRHPPRYLPTVRSRSRCIS